MNVDHERSMVEIDGRWLPACGLICPPTENEVVDDEWDFSLGVHAHDAVYIPLENGVLVTVVELENLDTFDVHLCAWTCERQSFPNEEDAYLPWSVGLRSGELVVKPDVCRDLWDWRRAEEWWILEFIDRVSRLSFEVPPGPKVQAVPVNRFEERAPRGTH